MKKIILLLFAFSLVNYGMAQNKGKNAKTELHKELTQEDIAKVRQKKENKELKKDRKHEDIIWEGTEGRNGKGPKATNRTPNKVGISFNRDYPNATNVTWTKYRGDWTATFGNGIYRSTAVYHANGERRDTRTIVSRDKIPFPVIQKVEEKDKKFSLGDIIKINLPNGDEFYRVKEKTSDKPMFRFFNKDGKEVTYDY